MTTIQEMRHCQHCHKMTMHIRQQGSCCHIAHAFITLFTCFLWFPIWIICALSASSQNTRSQCTTCGGVPQPPRPQLLPPPLPPLPSYRADSRAGCVDKRESISSGNPIRSNPEAIVAKSVLHGSLKLTKAIVTGEVYDFATQKWVPTYKDETV
jgi:hypothetical protein